jgi:hypothetical protein
MLDSGIPSRRSKALISASSFSFESEERDILPLEKLKRREWEKGEASRAHSMPNEPCPQNQYTHSPIIAIQFMQCHDAMAWPIAYIYIWPWGGMLRSASSGNGKFSTMGG